MHHHIVAANVDQSVLYCHIKGTKDITGFYWIDFLLPVKHIMFPL